MPARTYSNRQPSAGPHSAKGGPQTGRIELAMEKLGSYKCMSAYHKYCIGSLQSRYLMPMPEMVSVCCDSGH